MTEVAGNGGEASSVKRDASTSRPTFRAKSKKRRTVFVIHGRHDLVNSVMIDCLEALGYAPFLYEDARTPSMRYIGQVLDKCFAVARAAVVLFTPDDKVQLNPGLTRPSDGPEEVNFRFQPRANALVEAGMA